MNVKNLRDIRGIGPSVEEKLKLAFGNEEKALSALRESRIAEISSIEGIGERFALSLCRNLHYQETGEQIQNFLKTEDSIILYNRINDIISKFANTIYARSKLYLFFPLPISDFEKIMKRQETARLAQNLISLIIKCPYSLKDFNSYLKNISALKEQFSQLDTASRVIITTDKQIYEEFITSKVSHHCQIHLIEEMNQIDDYTSTHEEVIWIGSDIIFDENYPNIITVSESERKELTKIIPEMVLSFFARNKKPLESVAGLAKLLKSLPNSELSAYIDDLNLEDLMEMGNELTNLEESGEPNPKLNEDYSRLLIAEKNFENKLDEVLISLNEELEKKLQDTTLQLEGEKILNLIKGLSMEEHSYSTDSGRADLREYLDEELYLAVEEIIGRAEERLIGELKLQNDEIDYVIGIFPRELCYPVDPVDEVINRTTNFLRQKRAVKSFELKVSLAKTLEKYEMLAKRALNYMLELDYILMIGKFALKYQLILPTFIEGDKTGLLIEEGRNLFLIQQELKGLLNINPVSYAIGEIGKIDEIVNGERIILLSGANSGGKTTLLVSIGIMIILAQMGLPVPCKEAFIGGFSEFHYYRKSSGQMDAGAFETTLCTLSRMIMSPNSRMVLADEMESISEPGASARVIAAILDLLGRSIHSVGIFVTHLAQEIAKYSKEGLRIDGIEAHGLSEDLELIVNRTPIYYKYAKSTPELIVRRLKEISKGQEKEIYSYILDAFETG